MSVQSVAAANPSIVALLRSRTQDAHSALEAQLGHLVWENDLQEFPTLACELKTRSRIRHLQASAKPSKASRVENVSHARGQVGIGEWLGNQLNARIEATVMNDGIASISGRIENLQLRTPPECLFNKLASIHARQADIREQ